MSLSPSPIPGYINGVPYSIDKPHYTCMRDGYINCFHFATSEEKCCMSGDSEI